MGYRAVHDVRDPALVTVADDYIVEDITMIAGEAITGKQAVSIDTADPEEVLLANSGVATDRNCIGVTLHAAAAGLPVRICLKGKVTGVTAIAGTLAGAALYTSATNGSVDDATVAGSVVVGHSITAEAGGLLTMWVNPGSALS